MNLLEFDDLSGKADDDRAAAVRKYLGSNGWKYTSRHPGHIWMWSIEHLEEGENSDDDGVVTKWERRKIYVASESTALQFQRYWELEEQHFNSHDSDCQIFETFDWDDCNCNAGADGVPMEDDIAALDGDADE